MYKKLIFTQRAVVIDDYQHSLKLPENGFLFIKSKSIKFFQICKFFTLGRYTEEQRSPKRSINVTKGSKDSDNEDNDERIENYKAKYFGRVRLILLAFPFPKELFSK